MSETKIQAAAAAGTVPQSGVARYVAAAIAAGETPRG